MTNHCLKQFNEECYNVIQTFQRERNINVAIDVRDFNAQGDGKNVHQNKEQEEHFPMQSSCSFMQELLGKDNVSKDSHDAQSMNTNIDHEPNPENTINLDDIS